MRSGSQIGMWSLHFGQTGNNYVNFTKTKAFFEDGTKVPDTIEIKNSEYDTI